MLIVLFIYKVWIIRFHESPSCSRLVLLHLLLGVAQHLLMRLDVTGNTQQSDVADIVGQPFHLLLRSPRFNRHDMMAVNTRSYVWFATLLNSFLVAPLAQSVGSSPHDALHLFPSLVVQQLGVTWVSAHGVIPIFLQSAR